MTLSRKIVAAVEAAPAGGGSSPPSVVAAETGSHRLALALTDRGPVGLAFASLSFEATGRTLDLATADLRAWGARLAARLTYLMEPLVVLEVDAEAGEAELRSQNPTARADRRSFYEVRLRRQGALQLHRVAFDDASRRRSTVPCQMTVEVLERLADDLVASLG